MLIAYYYDGRSAKRHRVELATDGRRLLVQGQGIVRAASLAELKVSERLGSAPRRIGFADGAYCEVSDLAVLGRLLRRLGHRDGLVDRWQRSWGVALFCLALAAGTVFAGYFWGLPWTAARVAEQLPPLVVKTLSEQSLRLFDGELLKPSKLAPARIEQLKRGFAGFKFPHDRRISARILFRSSPEMGPNAFALPDGTIVLLDELVQLADHDEQIYAVLGHELGHVYHRHGLKLLVQSTLAGAFFAWWFGDMNSLVAAAPTVLLQARYSRGLEQEADAYAVTWLQRNSLQPARLAELLERLSRALAERGDSSWLDYLASHPASRERIQALRAASGRTTE
ncbi:MAG: M48 family metallopeptidase [Nevskiales bacterium]